MQTQYRDIPNSRLYNALRELDLRVEQYSNRRKAEICDMSYELDLPLRCLRLQLHNTHMNQVRFLAAIRGSFGPMQYCACLSCAVSHKV